MALRFAKRWPRLFVLIFPLVLLGILGTLYYILPVGNSFAAKTMCSCVFVADMHPDSVRKTELATLSVFDVEVDAVNQRTTGSFWGLRPRTVVYRPGLGCTVAAEVDANQLQSYTCNRPQRYLLGNRADTLYWPQGALDTLPLPEGVKQKQLEEVVHSLFVEDHPEGQKNTRAVVVVHQGKIVAEEYAEGFGPKSLMRGWSMTKSVTNAMVGLLVQQHGFDIYDPAPVPEWQGTGDARRQITTDMLLRMSSNLHFAEFYAFRTDATEMLFLEPDAGAYAAESELEGVPGTTWSYSSGTTNILSRMIRQQFERYQEYIDFPYQNLFGPLGMENVVMEPDASGTFVGSSFMWATARDWARFGLLYLNDGVWQGQRLLPEGWVEYSSTPTPTAPGGIYGAQFWTPSSKPLEGWYENWAWPGVPEGTYAAEGFEGQLVCMVPAKQTVIVRLGVTHDRATWDMGQWVADVLSCLPET